jgi:glycerol-3-phosphate acyltransferase PlsY
MFDLLAALGLGYLIGAIPNAALLAKLRGTSIFEVGSGNMGAMNTARNLGWLLGAAVLLLDMGKGALATLIGFGMVQLAGSGPLGPLAPPLAAGLGAVLGHAWSPYVGFRGGKALATTLGIAIPLYPIGGLYGLLLLIALVLMARRVALASILTMIVYPGVVLLTLRNAGWPPDEVFLVTTGVALVALVVIVKHLTILLRPGPTNAADQASTDREGADDR